MTQSQLEEYEQLSGTATIFNPFITEFISAQYFQNRELLNPHFHQEQSPKNLTFTDEKDLWEEVKERGLESVKVSLNNFYLTEWIPQSPGLFFTPKAESAREDALDHIQNKDDQRIIFDPWGKSLMVNGGIGCLRLTSKTVGGERIKFLSATSSGIAHRGFIVAMREDEYSKISPIISTQGGIQCSLDGSLNYWNSQFKFEGNPLFFGQEVPRVYLSLDRVHKISRERIPIGSFTVTAAVIFSHKAQGEYSSADVIHWTYSQFDPAIRDSVKRCASWMQEKYVQTMHQGRVLTDFDEKEGHIQGADFPVKSLMDPRTETIQIVDFVRTKLGIQNAMFIQNVGNLQVVEHMIKKEYTIGNVERGAIIQQGDIGNGAVVNIGTGRIEVVKGNKITINENLLDPKFGKIGEELANLRAEISALKTVPAQSRDESVNAVKNLEEEVAKDHPNPAKVEEYLKRVTSILNTAGETYEAGKPWVERIKSVVKALKTYAPLVGVTLAAIL